MQFRLKKDVLPLQKAEHCFENTSYSFGMNERTLILGLIKVIVIHIDDFNEKNENLRKLKENIVFAPLIDSRSIT